MSEKKFNTSVKLTVDWGDLDLFGHVNNVVYFKYIQSARVFYCEKIGLTSLDDPNKLSFMVASSQCRFKKPLHYPGEIVVKIRLDWVKNTSFQLEYRIEKNNDLIAEGEDVLVVFDHRSKQKIPMPDNIRMNVSRTERTAAVN